MDRKEAFRIGQKILEQEVDALNSLALSLGDSFWDTAQVLGHCEGLVWTTGVGTSAQVAARFAHTLTCCGARAMFLPPSDGLHGHSGVFTGKDVVVAMSRGGESAEVNQMVDIARQYRIPTIAFVHNVESTLARSCTHVLPITSKKEYELMGFVATTSTVAFSAMCDSLCAVVLEMKGYSGERFSEQFGKTHPGGAVGRELSSPQG